MSLRTTPFLLEDTGNSSFAPQLALRAKMSLTALMLGGKQKLLNYTIIHKKCLLL
jgi:hypothetical protein